LERGHVWQTTVDGLTPEIPDRGGLNPGAPDRGRGDGDVNYGCRCPDWLDAGACGLVGGVVAVAETIRTSGPRAGSPRPS
jgi:hypothetical protein